MHVNDDDDDACTEGLAVQCIQYAKNACCVLYNNRKNSFFLHISNIEYKVNQNILCHIMLHYIIFSFILFRVNITS